MINAQWLLYLNQSFRDIGRRALDLDTIESKARREGLSVRVDRLPDEIELTVEGNSVDVIDFITNSVPMLKPYIINSDTKGEDIYCFRYGPVGLDYWCNDTNVCRYKSARRDNNNG